MAGKDGQDAVILFLFRVIRQRLVFAGEFLEANREFVEKAVAFERNARTIVAGACAPYPLLELLPVLQERFMGMAITSEITDDDRLLSGVREGLYQIVILHERPEPDDGNLLLRKYLDERLYLTVPENHPFADKESVSFRELRELRVLVNWEHWILAESVPSGTAGAEPPDSKQYGRNVRSRRRLRPAVF